MAGLPSDGGHIAKPVTPLRASRINGHSARDIVVRFDGILLAHYRWFANDDIIRFHTLKRSFHCERRLPL